MTDYVQIIGFLEENDTYLSYPTMNISALLQCAVNTEWSHQSWKSLFFKNLPMFKFEQTPSHTVIQTGSQSSQQWHIVMHRIENRTVCSVSWLYVTTVSIWNICVCVADQLIQYGYHSTSPCRHSAGARAWDNVTNAITTQAAWTDSGDRLWKHWSKACLTPVAVKTLLCCGRGNCFVKTAFLPVGSSPDKKPSAFVSSWEHPA